MAKSADSEGGPHRRLTIVVGVKPVSSEESIISARVCANLLSLLFALLRDRNSRQDLQKLAVYGPAAFGRASEASAPHVNNTYSVLETMLWDCVVIAL